MASHKQKTTIMAKAGRRPQIEQRFGLLKNFHAAAQPWIKGVLPNDIASMTGILEQEPCTPAQATALEDAIEELLDRPQRIMDKMLDAHRDKSQKSFTLTLSELACLRGALRLD